MALDQYGRPIDSSRTRTYIKAPWTGGLNDSVDPGFLPDNDVTVNDNVIYTTSGTKVKRQGFRYFDNIELPVILTRASSGTNRTIVFANSLITSAPVNQKVAVGEKFVVSQSLNTAYNSTHAHITAVSTTTVSNDTITYTFDGAATLTETAVADANIEFTRASSTLDINDYWYFDTTSNTKEQLLMQVTSQPKIFAFDVNGNRTEVTPASSGDEPTAAPVTSACSIVFNNRYIVAFGGLGNLPICYYPIDAATTYALLPGNPPDCSILQQHLSRLFTNVKTNPDRLYYSSPGNHTEWGGVGDSAAIDFSIGDGDTEGITAIAPSFKGILFVGKGSKIHQMANTDPENWRISPLTNGLGILSQKAVTAVDMDDLVFVSRRGIHSAIASANFGDFQGEYLSHKIQNTFNTFDQARIKNMASVYVPTLNSIAFAVTERNQDANSSLYLYNVDLKEWYRWPSVSSTALCTALDGADNLKLMVGTADSRIMAAQNGLYKDLGGIAIPYRVRSGSIYPDGNTQTVKGFKKLSLLYKPKSNYNITVNFKVDNQATQSFSYTDVAGTAILGSTFVLGQSVLGSTDVLAPFTVSVDGYGRGCTIEILNSGSGEQIEIYGYILEYESAGLQEETRKAD